MLSHLQHDEILRGIFSATILGAEYNTKNGKCFNTLEN